MKPITEVDLLILGGGCAGLALGRELSRRVYGDRKVVILEQRNQHANDRTWCFWEQHDHPLRKLVSHTWPSWRFSSLASAVKHRGVRFSYQMIPAARYYADAHGAIRGNRNIKLVTGCDIQGVEEGSKAVKVITSRGAYRAAQIVDTRYSRHEPNRQPHLWQVFIGKEVVTNRERFDSTTAGLMEDLHTDEFGLCFNYCLPVSDNTALIEKTWFTTRVPQDLEPRLHADLRERFQGHYRVLRTESGCLPMGQPPTSTQPDSRIVRAGVLGGGIRPATGYAFQRIQTWARECAVKYLATGKAHGHEPDPCWMQRMDDLFLRVLKHAPNAAQK